RGARLAQRRFGRVTAPAVVEAATRVGRCGPHKNNKRNSLWCGKLSVQKGRKRTSKVPPNCQCSMSLLTRLSFYLAMQAANRPRQEGRIRLGMRADQSRLLSYL